MDILLTNFVRLVGAFVGQFLRLALESLVSTSVGYSSFKCPIWSKFTHSACKYWASVFIAFVSISDRIFE
jgi:hypothetical protein